MDINQFVNEQLELLELEKAAELEKNMCMQEKCSLWYLQKKGLCLPRLHLDSSESTHYGHTLHKFASLKSGSRIPSHSITVGDVAGILQKQDSQWVTASTGVVASVNDQIIGIACEKLPGSPDLRPDINYAVIRLVDDVTYRRLKNALKNLARCRSGRVINLVDVLFDKFPPSCLEESAYSNLTFFNDNLNESQKDAVKFSLCQKEVAIIHGPPGTGKTTTVVEVIGQLVAEGKKVLACASSNIAVDNLVEKLSSSNVHMIRLGHPARSLPGAHSHSLDAHIALSDGGEVIRGINVDIDHTKDLMERTTDKGERRRLNQECFKLIDDLKERKKIAAKQVMRGANVILSTFSGASLDGPIRHLPPNFFDVVVIDECSQALEAACWIALLHVSKCIVAGDHCQLPPTIMSSDAEKGGLRITLMERLIKLYGSTVTRMLTTQYRMNDIIMKWSSEQLYGGKLVAHSSVASHLLRDIPGVEDNENTQIPLLMIDTAGLNMHEIEDEDDSKGNEGEADLVAIHVDALVESGLRPADIAVVAPYNFQVDLLKMRLSEKYPKLEVKSVDGFQGREKEAVVLSLVRSNKKGKIGFLTEDRRINVAITRARRHLAVICDSNTVSNHEFLKLLLKYLEENGEVRSAAIYDEKMGTYCERYQKPTKVSKPPKHHCKPDISNKKKSGKSSSSSEKKASPMLHFEANVAYRNTVIEKYRPILKEFCEGPKSSLQFSSSLNDFERLIVHELAEEVDLIHKSQGEGGDRRIEVKKHSTPRANEHSFKILMDTCQLPQEEILNANVSAAENGANRKDIFKPIAKHIKLDHPKPNKKKKKPKLKPSPFENNSAVPEDFDSVIAAVTKANKSCSLAACKSCVSLMLQVCQFCRKQFCLSHMMPEIHGCGDAAKAHARSMIRKDGVIYPGSGRPEKKLDPAKRAQLQRDLVKTLRQYEKNRQPKPKA